ncbi:hypothetical protein [Methanobrevibacter sp.]|uniref:IS256 family transposase, variant Zn-binding type n=1 Tax=Methanobrevibacter sp. TaxID=66852 RepID=UPI003890E42F
MHSKACPQCNCTRKVIKYGKQSGRQRYYCKDCKAVFQNKKRPQKLIKSIWNDFVFNNMSAEVLAEKHDKHPNTIRKIINNYEIDTYADLSKLSSKEKDNISVIIMDATYFGRDSGYLVVINAHNGRLLYFKEFKGSETNLEYWLALKALRDAKIHPKACVIDGRRGVREMLEESGIAVQYCLFHVDLEMKRCLTRNPILLPNIELRNIVKALTSKHSRINRKTFECLFYGWSIKYALWLQERDENGDFSHTRTRKLVNYIKRNLMYFFTFQDYPELKIPRTSNRIEGKFGNAKTKLKLHRGYSKSLRTKIFFSLLSGRTEMDNN